MATIYELIFSPAGSTEKVSQVLAQTLGTQIIQYDLTSPLSQGKSFQSEDIVLCAVPVYGGRPPAIAVERIKKFRGNRTPVVLVAVYGNREYEDTFLELGDHLESQGFIVVAAGAFIAQHVFAPQIGEGRPNTEDIQEIQDFGKKILQKYQTETSHTSILAQLPGNRPYKDFHGAPLAPLTSDACTHCKLCAQTCPVEAIPIEYPSQTITEKCILCTRCIRICPTQARFLPKTFLDQVFQMLQQNCDLQRRSEIFL